MPPKQRFNSQDVIDAAFEIVRREGWEGLSARNIAKKLNSSTRPIYDYLKSMKHIEAEVVNKALAYFVEYIGRDRTGDKWLDQALGYVLFAAEEKHLFRCINDESHIGFQKQFAKRHWANLGEQISEDERFRDLPKETVNRIRTVRWFLIHGLSYLVSNGWFELNASRDFLVSDENAIRLLDLLKKANQGVYEAFRE